MTCHGSNRTWDSEDVGLSHRAALLQGFQVILMHSQGENPLDYSQSMMNKKKKGLEERRENRKKNIPDQHYFGGKLSYFLLDC